jgi:chromosome partitioning protein
VRGRLLDATRAALARDGAPLLDASLGNRSAFAMAMAAGLGVTESAPKGLAAEEVRGIAAALRPWIGDRA